MNAKYNPQLNLTGNREKPQWYKHFPGNPLEQMPLLLKHGYHTLPVAKIMGRHLSAPTEVKDNWRNRLQFLYTIDGVAYNEKGEALIILNAQPLRALNPESKLVELVSKHDGFELTTPDGVSKKVAYRGALKLSPEQWYQLKEEETTLPLTRAEVDQIQGKGYLLKNGIWQPENAAVGKYWEHLGRDLDLQEYAQSVAEITKSSAPVMVSYLDKNRYAQPVLRSLVMGRLFRNSPTVIGYYPLNCSQGSLVGVRGRRAYQSEYLDAFAPTVFHELPPVDNRKQVDKAIPYNTKFFEARNK